MNFPGQLQGWLILHFGASGLVPRFMGEDSLCCRLVSGGCFPLLLLGPVCLILQLGTRGLVTKSGLDWGRSEVTHILG